MHTTRTAGRVHIDGAGTGTGHAHAGAGAGAGSRSDLDTHADRSGLNRTRATGHKQHKSKKHVKAILVG